MAVLDASANLKDFDMSFQDSFFPQAPLFFSTSTRYAWSTPEGDAVHAIGGGITVHPNTHFPTGWAVNILKFDLENDGNTDTNFQIDAILTFSPPVSLTDLVGPNGEFNFADFWQTLLSGNDELIGPNNGNGFLFGDFLTVTADAFNPDPLTGGNDFLHASPTSGEGGAVRLGGGGGLSSLVGDAYQVIGTADPVSGIAYDAVLDGGNDTISMSGVPAYFLIGDAYFVHSLGIVLGGNDTITSNAVPRLLPNRFSMLIVGDAAANRLGVVQGGRDTITGSNHSFQDDTIAGDTFEQEGGVTTGGPDVIEGRGGHDFIGGDVYRGADRITGGFDTIHGGADADVIAGDVLQYGNDGQFGAGTGFAPAADFQGANDILYGDAGDDWIAGDIWQIAIVGANSDFQGGGDTIDGGDGDDLIFGEFSEQASLSSGTNTFGGQADTIDGGNGNDTIKGQFGNDILRGGAGNDLIDGGVGADRMTGSTGDDTYGVDGLSDVVTELAGQGIDRVESRVSHTLALNVENLTLLGSANINGTGNTLANTIVGNTGANTLDGKAGADTMGGGDGNDTYIVDNLLDVVNELGTGNDLVKSSVTRTLEGAVERLELTGTANINGTGNGLVNQLTGNGGNNLLDGRAGADTMRGGLGDDTYVIDDSLDTVTELANGGTDTIRTFVTKALFANVENLTLIGSNDIGGTGNALDNVILGNDRNNTLNGAGGDDTMRGGLGDDSYIVDSLGDLLTEFSNSGTDRVTSSVTFTLGINFERLTLTGTLNIAGTGNTLDNIISGNTGRNTLDGLAGNDQLLGAAGNDILKGGLGLDTLTGGAGFDSFNFDTLPNATTNRDTITDYVVAEDTIRIDNAVFTGLPLGTLAASAFVVGAAAVDASDRIIYNDANGRLYFDRDGTGAIAAIQFATLDPGLALTNGDIVVI